MAQKSRFGGFIKKEIEKERGQKSKKMEEILQSITVMNGAPLSARAGINGNATPSQAETQFSFTGLGEDGVLQPDNPAKIVNTSDGPATLHEGELEIKFPDGNTQVIPADQVPQDLMKKMEMQGFKCGGSFKRFQGGGTFRRYQDGGQFQRGPWDKNNPFKKQIKPTKPIDPIVGPTPVDPNVTPFTVPNNIVGPNPDPINIDPIQTGTNPTPNNLIGGQIGGQVNPFTNNKPFNNNFNITKPNKVPVNNGQIIQGGNVLGKTQGGITPFGKPINPSGNNNDFINKMKELQQQGKIPVNNNTNDPILITNPNNIVVDPFTVQPDDPFVVDPNTVPDPVDPNTTPVDPVNNQGQLANQYMNQLFQISQGQNTIQDKLAQQTAEKFKGEEQAAKEALTQQLGQEGVGGREARTEQAMQSRQIGQAEADVMSDLAQQEGQQAFQAAQQLPGLAQNQQQIGQGQQQIDNQNAQFLASLSQNNEQFKEQLDFAKQKYGDLEGQRIAADIAQGLTYDQIKAKYPNVTQADYDSIKAAGPIGQQEWQKEAWQKQFNFEQDQWDYNNQQNAFNTLLNSGDFDNAAKMFESIYGESIDFSHLKSEVAANKFNEAFNNMNGLIAAGTSWDQALKVMKTDGSFEKLGMTEGDAQAFYEEAQLMADPLYKAFKMADTWVEQGIITQEQADDFNAFLAWSTTNPQGVDIEDGFSVKDKDGNEVGFFTNEADALKFINDNPNSGYTSEAMENHITVNDNSGTGTGTGTNTGDQVPDWADPDFYAPLKETFGEDLTEEQYNIFEKNYGETTALLDDKYGDMNASNIGGLKEAYDAMPDTFKATKDFGSVIQNISPEQAKIYEAKENGDFVDMSEDELNDLFHPHSVHWETKGGKKRWMLNDNFKDFLKENKGKYINMGGKMMKIKDYRDGNPDSSLSSPYITFVDPKTNTEFQIKINGRDRKVLNSLGLYSAYDGLGVNDSAVSSLFGLEWPESAKTEVENLE